MSLAKTHFISAMARQFALLGLCTTGFLGPASVPAAQLAVCDAAASYASERSVVPVDIMRAITRVETGRLASGTLQPWPWTVNLGGEGAWFDTRETATAYVHEKFRAGHRDFDVGCFQINYRWHSAGFRSIDEMLDPTRNALYAAGFLEELYAEFGSWPAAVRAFHSRTPDHAERYYKKFVTAFAQVTAGGARRSPDLMEPNVGLLASTNSDSVSGAASLVPLPPSGPGMSLAFFEHPPE